MFSKTLRIFHRDFVLARHSYTCHSLEIYRNCLLNFSDLYNYNYRITTNYSNLIEEKTHSIIEIPEDKIRGI